MYSVAIIRLNYLEFKTFHTGNIDPLLIIVKVQDHLDRTTVELDTCIRL